MDVQKESLLLHEQWQGKLEVISRIPVADKREFISGIYPGSSRTMSANSEGC